MTKKIWLALALFCNLIAVSVAAELPNFSQAKKILRNDIYFDQTAEGTFYCGCQWRWMGATGGRIDTAGCGYEVRTNRERAQRLEWEHLVPASLFGRARQCWQQGGRENCTKNDPVFALMEGDLHNLVPSVGEVNGDRGNFNFAAFTPGRAVYGACPIAIDFKARRVNPPAQSRGHIARTYFYMHDRYDLPMSLHQQQLLMAWHKAHPVTQRESLLNERIARSIGHSNEFITGARVWQLRHVNRADGVQSAWPRAETHTSPKPAIHTPAADDTGVRGNRKSKVYHLAQGCPHYASIGAANRVEFSSEAAAQKAGYTKAGNCR